MKTSKRGEFIESNTEKGCVEVGVLRSFAKNMLKIGEINVDTSDCDDVFSYTRGRIAPPGLIKFLNWFMDSKESTLKNEFNDENS